MNIPIIYEDDYLMVVDKPSGLLTVATPRNEKRTLTSILGLFPCHRLDRGTSGLIIYAKDRLIQRKMAEVFKNRQVQKTYLALVNGILKQGEGVIRKRIEGMPAETYYKVIENKAGFSIVEVKPFTGRTNQIRIHFKSLGHPVLGDDKFAFRRDFKVKARRLMLHAKELQFNHPVTGKRLKLGSPLPSQVESFLKKDV